MIDCYTYYVLAVQINKRETLSYLGACLNKRRGAEVREGVYVYDRKGIK